MALNFYLDKIENYKELCWEPAGQLGKDGEELVRIKPKTDSIIWATMLLGLNKITEKNLVDWATRWKLAAGVGWVYSEVTLEDIRAHIGLRTNASPLTAAKFRANLYKGVEREAKQDVQKLLEAANA